MNVRPIISGIIGAAAGLLLLWAIHAIFFQKAQKATDAVESSAKSSAVQENQFDSDDNIIELAPVTTSSPAAVHETVVKTVSPTSEPASAPVFLTPQDPLTRAKQIHNAQEAILAGDRASSSGDRDFAVACFRRATELDPTNMTALEALAIALLANDEVEQTVAVYEKIIKLNPADRSAVFNLAMAYIRLKRYENAEEIYNDILNSQPNDIKARTNLATLLQIQNRPGEARQQWMKVTDIDSTRQDAWEHIGEISVDMGEPAAAMDAYSQAARLSPADPTVWKNFAITARQAGSGGRAVFAYKKALELEPENSTLWKDLGNVFLEVYRVKKDRDLITQAVGAWKESIKLNPNQDDVKKLLEIYDTAPTSASTEK
ncbi:MAG TPA: tetratricopeptide repeat protein [Phycisphaerae bacterium]|nr:tetratricopeptide repeat protein [Phycisphaerae bacterium]